MQSWDGRAALVIRCFRSSALERELLLDVVLTMYCSIHFSPCLSVLPRGGQLSQGATRPH